MRLFVRFLNTVFYRIQGNVMLWLHFQHPKKPAKCSDPSTVMYFIQLFAASAIANHHVGGATNENLIWK